MAPALYFSGGSSVLATAQFSIIKDKWHRTEHSDKKKKKKKRKEGKKKASAQGAHDCWPSCLSSLYKILSANLSGMLSELITSSEGGGGGRWGEDIVFSAQCSHLLNRVLIFKLQISLFGSLKIKAKM